MELEASAGSVAAEPARPLALGRRLRPIVFGGVRGAPNAFAATHGGPGPQLVLSVHSLSGRLLGFAVIDRYSRPTWGGMSISEDVTPEHALARARTATRQLEAFGYHRGGHHASLIADGHAVGRDRRRAVEEFLDALWPLAGEGLCRIAFIRDGDRLEPRLACGGFAASVAACSLATVEALGGEPMLATIAVNDDGPLPRAAISEAANYGMRIGGIGRESLDADVDVLLLADDATALDATAAGRIRAAAVVCLGPDCLSEPASELLVQRGVAVVSDTLATAGALLALDFRARGADERSALARTFTLVYDRARELEPVSPAVQSVSLS